MDPAALIARLNRQGGRRARADVRFDAERLIVDLADGRSIAVPLAWYPPPRRHPDPALQLDQGRRRLRIRWPDVDEPPGVAGVLSGTPAPRARRRAVPGDAQGIRCRLAAWHPIPFI